jgi:hypothetical protein
VGTNASVDVSRTLNGAYGLYGTNGGQIVWVPTYRGAFSSANTNYSFVTVKARSTNSPANARVITWPLQGGNVTNSLYYTTNLTTGVWNLLTNIVVPGAGSNYTYIDKVHTNGSVFYRLGTKL